ncbi:hypothetical protein Lal_00019887 [Lupinus albus]|nr:hypothetical protein Lal_00019887 [Lupinus albus]
MGSSSTKAISPFRLSSLLRSQNNPSLAFQLFLNPNPPNPNSNSNANADSNSNTKTQTRPFRYSLLSYDLIITKLGRAKMFPEMEQVLHLLRHETRFNIPEPLLCHVISFYAHARLPSRAIHFFHSIPSFPSTRTVKSFNSLLNALLISRQFDKFGEFVSRVHEFAIPDACTFNIMINACCLRGELDNAYEVFDEMRKRNVRPNVVTYGTLINGLCKNSRLREALKLKEEMERVLKLKPNVLLYTTLIKGVCEVGKFGLAFRLKDEMVRNNVKLDAAVYNTIIAALFKGGRKEEGLGVLKEMKKSGCEADIVTYNVLIVEFCREENFEKAFKVLDKMEVVNVKADVVSYNVIIGGMCKVGKWSEANDLFQDMARRGCAPDVVTYRTLFDGLCDSMQFREAAFVLDEMMFKGFVPLSTALSKFVRGLCKHGDFNFELLVTVLSGLGRGNFLYEDIWEIVVSRVCKPGKLLEPFEILDTLVITRFALRFCWLLQSGMIVTVGQNVCTDSRATARVVKCIQEFEKIHKGNEVKRSRCEGVYLPAFKSVKISFLKQDIKNRRLGRTQLKDAIKI